MKRCTKCGEEKAESEFYFSGYVRNDGQRKHVARCKSCYAEGTRKCYEANKEKRVKYAREYREAHKEKGMEYARNYREENREEIRKSNARTRKERRFIYSLRMSLRLAKRHGYKPCSATPEELEVSFTGRCGICGVPELECSHRLAMDHDHETGEFRGWLCGGCNRALGLFKDSEDILIDAIHYLMQGEFK